MALNGANGYLYSASLGAETTSTGAITPGTWCKITAIAGAGFPATLEVNDVVYASSAAAITLATGDKYKAVTLSKLAFVTDITDSESKEKFEDTVQTDEVKSFIVGAKPEVSGSVTGFFIDNDTVQKTLLGKFKSIITETTTGGISKIEPNADTFHSMLSICETTNEDRQIWAYKPMAIDSLEFDKTMEGPIPFSFNYSEVGSEKPSVLYTPVAIEGTSA